MWREKKASVVHSEVDRKLKAYKNNYFVYVQIIRPAFPKMKLSCPRVRQVFSVCLYSQVILLVYISIYLLVWYKYLKSLLANEIKLEKLTA